MERGLIAALIPPAWRPTWLTLGSSLPRIQVEPANGGGGTIRNRETARIHRSVGHPAIRPDEHR